MAEELVSTVINIGRSALILEYENRGESRV
jgi:hypothetical protein